MASHEQDFVESVSLSSWDDLSEDSIKPTSKEDTRGKHQLELTLSERVKVRCFPRVYQIRRVRSKGAILVLLLNCLIANNAGPLSGIIAGVLGLRNKVAITTIVNVVHGVSFLFYPFAGWIADVKFGRYKVIRTSLQLMWAGIVVVTASLCIDFSVGMDLKPLHYVVFPLALVAIECGIAGFKANAIPFGIDQLLEGSGEELSAYIHWFVFTIMVNVCVISVPFSCFLEDSNHVLVLQLLVQAACLSLALCLDFCLRNWLVMEPKTTNPFKIIYQVLSYAQKNKRAKFRSAFTYHVEEIPSRLELSKPQYGGPFTVEQVEDVKTFLRMLSVLVPMSLAVMMGIVANSSIGYLSNHMPSTSNCILRDISGVKYSRFLSIILVPIFEFLLYPFLHNLIPSMLVRAGIGTAFYIASFLAQLALDTVGHLHTNENSASTFINSTTSPASTCIFTDDSADLMLNYGWIAIPATLRTIGVLLNLIAVYEFVFAQAPYSMKGLFVGLKYGIEGVFRLIFLALVLPFLLGAGDSSQDFPTCGFFYFLMSVVITAVALVWYSYAAWKYKKRQRDHPERHSTFAEEYYDKYLQLRHIAK